MSAMHDAADEDADASADAGTGQPTAPPGGDFGLFLQKLRIQTFLSLGLLPNPLTGVKRCQLEHAQALLDDLAMLREKTAGNLTAHEERLFGAILEELEGQFEQQRQRAANSSSARR
ncbi:MAG: DUF1844 domain-containing protein [Planctomycetes bacterium]|nr:DUF1844 domain-containing protein [Planctomycetota bacterium]